jgi:hypothetical protein
MVAVTDEPGTPMRDLTAGAGFRFGFGLVFGTFLGALVLLVVCWMAVMLVPAFAVFFDSLRGGRAW